MFLYATAGLVALAALVAAHRLGAKSYFLDETLGVEYARPGLINLLKVIAGGDPNGGLYYALLYLWAHVFGFGEIGARWLSVVCGALAVIGMVALGNRLYGARAGLISGLLLALAPCSFSTSRRLGLTRL